MAACTYRIAFGLRAGQKVLTVQGAMPRQTQFKQTLCADINGFSLHAAVHCAADNRDALEQLCRTITAAGSAEMAAVTAPKIMQSDRRIAGIGGRLVTLQSCPRLFHRQRQQCGRDAAD